MTNVSPKVKDRIQDLERDYAQTLDRIGSTQAVRHVQRSQATRSLHFYGKQICTVVHPTFVARSDYNALMNIANTLSRAIDTVEYAARASADIATAILGTGRLYDLGFNQSNQHRDFVGRFDGFLDDSGQIRFVEYNPGSCGGMFFADACLDIFDELDAVKELRTRWSFQGMHLADRYSSSLTAACAAARGSTRVDLALVLPASHKAAEALAASPEVHALLRLHEEAGGKAAVVSVDSLKFDGKALTSETVPLQAILVLDWTDLVDNLSPSHPIWQAAEGSGTWVANPLSSFLLRGSKSVFAVLSDPSFEYLFDAMTLATIRKHIPWTRTIQEQITLEDGNTVNLSDYLIASKNSLVLKPSFSIGGRNVVLGWESSDAEWNAAIARAMSVPYVVQNRVPMSKKSYLCIDHDELVEVERFSDLCPFVWLDGESYGLFTRLSGNAMMNMSSGSGSTTAIYVLDDQMDPWK